MDEWNKRVETKLDTVVADLGAMKITSAEQHIVLKEHIRRTELLEEDMKPIKKHVYRVDGALKLIGLLGILASIFEAVMWATRK